MPVLYRLAALVLWQGMVPFGLMMALFFGAYFFIAVWMLGPVFS
jgi:hypothetical protein